MKTLMRVRRPLMLAVMSVILLAIVADGWMFARYLVGGRPHSDADVLWRIGALVALTWAFKEAARGYSDGRQ